MHCKVRIENQSLDRATNAYIGRNIGELCKQIAGTKLTADDYIAIARMRYELRADKLNMLSVIKSDELRDAVRLMPVFMAAYLLYMLQYKLQVQV